MGPSKMVVLVVLAAAHCPWAHCAGSPAVAADAAFVAVVKDGRLDDGRWVGTHASQLMAHVLSTFPALEPGWELGLPTVVNGSSLRYLVLDGAYLADVPLLLPSLCVLQLTPTATIRPAANLTLKNTTSFTGLVSLWDVHFSAVVGGTIDASDLPAAAFDYPYARGYMAVAIKGGGNNAVRHVRAASNNSDGALGITKSPNSEIANVDVGGGGSSGHGMTIGRCIWILATSRALVHDNWVRNCSAHALDFDAYGPCNGFGVIFSVARTEIEGHSHNPDPIPPPPSPPSPNITTTTTTTPDIRKRVRTSFGTLLSRHHLPRSASLASANASTLVTRRAICIGMIGPVRHFLY